MDQAMVMTRKMIELFGIEIAERNLTENPLNLAAFIYLGACLSYLFAIAKAGDSQEKVWNRTAEIFVLVAWVFHTIGFAGRWYAGGLDHPPWTNLYESLIAFSWMFSTFQIYALRKGSTPLLGALLSPLIFLLMGMGVMTPDKAVAPLIPALQSYWLTVHVLCGMLSYAGFAMAACFGVLHLFKNLTIRYPKVFKSLPLAQRLEELVYQNVLIAFTFQTLLIVTGAIWAKYAWGRSWGWEPKEVWALITWLVYLLYLHGRLVFAWKPNTLSALVIGGFIVLIFAFLGVNLVLSGLHSYGAA